MITRQISSAHICLRYQLQHSRLIAPVGNFATAARQLQGVRQEHSDSQDAAPNRLLIRRTLSKSELPAGKLSEFPLDLSRTFQGHVLRERSEELDVDALGRRSTVFVLSNSGVRVRRPRIYEEEPKAEHLDILAQLDSERGLVGQDEVHRNIEELKPGPDIQTLTGDEFRDLEKRLHDGFTITQLAKYVASVSPRRTVSNIEASIQEGRVSQPEDSDLEKVQNLDVGDGITGTTIRVSAWMPGISETGDDFEESYLRGYVHSSFTQKQRLLTQLLRQCWHLEIKEIGEDIGEIEIELPDIELELLLKGKEAPLRMISDEFLGDQDERIEAFRSRQVIRVTATHEKCKRVVEEIQRILLNVHHIELDMSVLSGYSRGPISKSKKRYQNLFPDSMLAELAQLTETEIGHLPNNKISVSFIDRTPGTTLSTPFDVARRLLATLSESSDHTIYQQATADVREPILAIRYENSESLPWHNRLRNWVRWNTSTPKSSVEATESTRDPPSQQSQNNTDIFDDELIVPVMSQQKELKLKKQRDAQDKTSDYSYWDDSYLTTSSLVVGHILHESKNSSAASTILPTDEGTRRKIFLPTAMNLSQILAVGEGQSTKPVTSLRMRFIPSPWSSIDPTALKSFPPVEMRFSMDDTTKDLELKDVLAITESAVSDIILPDRAVDLRFRQRTTARLQTSRHHQLPQITEFLNASQLNIQKGRLLTPPTLTLPIAKHLVSAKGAPAADIVDVEYLYAGLEYRNAFATTFRGWKLLYTSIEGGKADGSRCELSLRPTLANNDKKYSERGLKATELQVLRSRSFIEAAYGLVDAIEDPVQNKSRKCILKKDKLVKTGENFGFWRRKVDFRVENWVDDSEEVGPAREVKALGEDEIANVIKEEK